MISQLTGFNVRSITRFTFISFMAMELDAAGLKFLRNSPDVSSIAEDLPNEATLAESVPLIGGNAAWDSGFSGAGQTIAILDTGVNKTHSFLSGKVVSEACYSTTDAQWISVCPGGVTASTSPGSGVNCSVTLDCRHGTHVAGIAAGKGVSFSGVAKDANLIAIQVFSQFRVTGGGGPIGALDSNLISGLERVLELRNDFNISAVNMSLGRAPITTNCDGESGAMKAAVDSLRSFGIATVIASGNNGVTNGISFPSCISSAISVGSTDDGSGGTIADDVSSFSNSASSLKLLAPGNVIVSSVPGGAFAALSGTSMATPHVAGAWAILKSKAPSATVDQVLQALTSTGVPITDTRNGITKPRIRVDLALGAVPHVLTIASSNPDTGVNITVSPNDNSNLGSGTTQFSRTYNHNTSVTLTAPASAGGNNFQKWQRDGVDLSTNSLVNVTMDADHTLTAVYVTPPPPTQTLTVNSSNPGSGVSITVSPNDNSNLGTGTTQFSRTYNQNTTVTLTAPTTAGGNNFQKWQRDGSDLSTNQVVNVMMDADHTMTAVYVTPTRTLTVASSNPGSGVSITVSPNDNSNLGTGTTQFSRTYNQNTSVTLTAPTTVSGNNFQKWQRDGVDLSTNQVVNVTMAADHTMTAVYVTPTRTLTVASLNPGSGVSITVSPNDNSNLGTGTSQFSRTYNQNTSVTLTAPTTAGGNNFQKWQRDGVDLSTNQVVNVTMDADHTLTAVYVTPTRTLTVASSNPGSGVSITVSPNDNSNLGTGTTQFSRTYNQNTTVTLTAPATAGGNNFQKWQRNGVDWSTSQSTSVTMDANYTLTAVYVTPPRSLTVTSLNPGSGVSITVSPNDNSNLGNGTTQFSRTYNHNTNVTLTAPATAGGNNFQKWQRNGVDWSNNPSTSVTMDADYTMRAVYIAPPRTLSIASTAPGSGVTITVSPADINNGGSGTTPFNRTYNLNTTVTLTAPATAGGNNFQKWQRDGVDWTTTRSTTVTMDANHSMMAVYVAPPAAIRTLTVAASDPPDFGPITGLSITVSPNDNNNQGNGATQFSRTYNNNTTVTLTAPATAGAKSFRRWQRNRVDWSTSRTTSVTLDANYTMTAVYGVTIAFRTLTVASSNPNSGVSITVSPDINSQGTGTTQFTRTYSPNATVTLTAPATAGGNNFQKWQRNGVDWSTNPSTSVTMDAFSYTLTAVYVSSGGGEALVATPAVVGPGDLFNVNCTTAADLSIADWIGLFRTAAPNNTWFDFRYLPAWDSGSPAFTAPTTPGNFNAFCPLLRADSRSFYAFQ